MKEMLLAIRLLADDLPKLASLYKIFVAKLGSEGRHWSCPVLLEWYLDPFALSNRAKLREDVVWVTAIIAINSSGTIPHIWGVDGIGWPVWRELEVIWPNTIAVSVGIAEHSRLQNCMSCLLATAFFVENSTKGCTNQDLLRVQCLEPC